MTVLRARGAAAICAALGLIWFAPDSRADSDENVEQTIWQQIEALPWAHGPRSVSALQNAMFQLPDHYIFLDTGQTNSFLRITQNVPSDVPEQIFGPDDLHWWAFMEFSEDGYVKDGETRQRRDPGFDQARNRAGQ